MTTHTTAVTRYRDHTVVGAPDHIANLITNHHSAGTLLGASQVIPLDGGRVAVKLRLRDTTPAPPVVIPASRSSGYTTRRPADTADMGYKLTIRVRSARSRRRRRTLTIAAITAVAVVTLLALAAYLVAQLVALVVEHAAILAGLAGLTLLVLAALRSGGSTGRRHCPGCH
jgi:hypothetical protein